MNVMIYFITAHVTNLVGFLFFAIGAFRLCSQYTFFRRAVPATGNFKGWQQNKEYLWRPIVVFTTNEGKTIEFVSAVGTNPRPSWEIDRPVGVLYDPAKPEEAQIYTFLYFWLLPIFIFILGLGCMFAPAS
jgi:hypothetical protein